MKNNMKNILKQLKALHADDSVKKIIEEANKSSNPEYIYDYWGVKGLKV